MTNMASRGVPLRLAVVVAWILVAAGSAGAGGALKISAVRTDGAYGDNTTMVFPNGRLAIVDGGDNSANSNKLTAYLDSIVGAGGTIWYMCMSHPHTDHFYGLDTALNQYVVMRYYSSFPENDVPAQTSAGTAAYATTLIGRLNAEFSTPYTTNANCYEVIATANSATTAKVSGTGTNLGPGWDPTVDSLVTSGEEMSSNAASNSNSVEYHIWYGSNTYESGGDMPGPAEADPEGTALTNYGGTGGRLRQNVSLAKMHHHGGNASNLAAWLDPSTGITPVGKLNRYSFACTGDVTSTANIFDTVGRNAAAGREMYRTDLDGTVRFASIGDGNWSIVRQYIYSEGGTSSHLLVAAPPAAGTLAGAASGTSANLSWGALTGATTYYVYRSTVTGGIDIPFVTGEDMPAANYRTGSVRGVYSRLVQVASAGTTYQDAGLASGSYYYRLKASDSNGYESEYSNEVTVTISGGGDTTAPAAPTGLAVADVPADQGVALRLNWTLNTEADMKDYGVYRAVSSGALGTKTLITRVNQSGTTHQDGGLVANTTYYYQLTARDTSLNESGGSTEASASPADNLAPAAPVGLGVVDVPSDQGGALRVSWTANTEGDIKDYRIRRSTGTGITAQTTILLTIAAPGTTSQDAGLANGTTYYYRLTARDASTNESGISASDVGAFPVDNLAPAAPSGLGAADVAGDQGGALRLSWTASTEADRKDYRIWRSTNNGVTQVSSALVTGVLDPGTTHQDSGLVNGTTYYYELTARDTTLNESGPSPQVSAVPLDNLAPGAPAGLGVVDVPADQGGALRLSWTANTEADLKDYGVYRATWVGASPAPTPARMASPGTTKEDAGLSNGVTYYFRLTARDISLNESGYSAEASAIPYDNLAPSTPAGLGLADPGTTVLNLSWTASTELDLKDYGVYRATYSPVGIGGAFSPAARIISPGTTHQDGTGVVGTRYYYRSTARDVSLNESGGSAEVSGVPGAPGAPSGLTVADVAGDQGAALQVNWTANSEGDLKDYRVRRSTATGLTAQTPVLVTITSPGTTHQDTGLATGTTLYYRLTARDTSLNESAISAADVGAYPADNLAPAAPSGLGAEDVPADQGFSLRVSWTSNTEADLKDYGIYRATYTGAPVAPPTNVARIAAPGTTHQDAGLSNGVTYYYRLTSRDASLNESGGAVETSTIPYDNLAPAAPAGLGLSDPGTTVLSLSWSGNTEADLKDYRLYRSTNAGVTLVSSHVLTAVASPGTTHQDAGLATGARYNYRITARDASLNESGGAAEISGIPGPPGAPSGLSVADVPSDEGGGLNLSWSSNSEADLKDYRVFRSTNGNVTVGSSWTVTLAVIAQPGTTHQDAGLLPVTTYYYKLTARDGSLNESSASGEVNLRPVDNLAPAIPGEFSAGSSTNAVNLSWVPNTESDLRDYRVWRSTNSGVTLVSSQTLAVVTAPGTTHQDAGLTNGTTYYFRLTARDGSGNESGGAVEVSANPSLGADTTPPAAPAGLGAADEPSDQGGRVRLSWTANTELDFRDYRVYRSTFSSALGQKAVVADVLTPGTTHADGGLNNGTTYYYRLTARDTNSNESGGSAEASATPSDNLTPAIPGGIGVVDVPTDQGFALRLIWTANTEADLKDYGVYRATYTGAPVAPPTNVTRIASPGTTHQDGGLTNGTTFYYRLTARDVNSNESAGSTEVSAVPIDNLSPATPVGLGVVDVPADQGFALRLSWTMNTEADLKDYGVYQATWAGASPAPTPTRILTPGTTHQAAGLTNGATYYYRLTARDASLNESGGSSEVSAIPYDNLAPGAPAGLGVGDVPGDQGFALRLSWTANTEADLKEYGLYRATYSPVVVGAGLSPARVSAPGTTHQDGGLTNGTTFYYRLTARDASLNESGGSSEVSAIPYDNLAPGAPVGVGVADVPGDQGFALRLSWTANTESDLKDYGVFRATSVGGADAAPTRIAAPGTTYQADGLTNGATYYFRLSARDGTLNESGYSTEVSATPYDNLAPAAPSGLTVGDPGTAALTLSWSANTEADLKDYRVYRATYSPVGTGGGFIPAATIAVPGTTHQDGNVVVGTRYYYAVAARDVSFNESGGSPEASGVPGAPAAPGGVGVADVAGDQGFALRLSWTANTEVDVKDYGVYRATWAGASPAPTPTRVAAPGTTYQDGGLTNGATFYFRLTARDTSLNESGYSTEVSAIPYDNLAPAAPGGPGLSDPGTTVLNLSWTANTEGDMKDYAVYRSTYSPVTVGAGASPAPTRITAPGTTHQDGAVVVGQRYYYRVTARDVSLNESGGSAELSGVPGTPAPPGGLGVADIPADQGTALRVSWSSGMEADLKDYGVYRATFAGAGLQGGPAARIAAPGTTRQDGGLVPNTTYYYRLTARDASLNESAGSAEVSAYPVDDLAPAPPTGAGAASPGLGSRLNLSWIANSESDVKEYRIWRGLASGSLVTKSVLNVITAPGTTHQDAGLVNGTTYYYQVTARDAGLNESGGSSECSGIPQDSTPPAMPIGFGVADAGTGSGINLSWTMNTEPDLKDYRVYRSTNNNVTVGSTWTVLVGAVASPGTTRQDAGLAVGTAYFYRLTARDMSLNESSASPESSASTQDYAPPLPVVGLGAADVPGDQGGQLRLSWTANSEGDLKEYTLWRGLTSGSIPDTKFNIATIASPGTTHLNTGLVPGATYYYQVTARDLSLNESDESMEIFAYPVDNLAPAPPTGFGIADPGVGLRLSLSWTDNTETDRRDYRVWRGLTSGSLVTKSVMAVITAPATMYQDAGLVNGTTYYYQLTIRDASLNESGGSAEASGIPQDVTPPAAPSGVGVTNPNLGLRLDVSWTANTETDLKDYRVYRSTNGNVTVGSTWTVLVAAVASPGTTHQDAGLLNGTAYHYRLTARDGVLNESARSAETSATPLDATAPATPAGFGVLDTPLDQGFALWLSWTANTESDLKEYRLWRALASGGIGTKALTGLVAAPGTTHQDSGLVNGTTYYYQMTARDVTLNESSPTGEISSFPYDNLSPAVPSGVGIGDPGTTVLNLSWSANTEADLKDYGVYRATYSPGPVGSGASPAPTRITAPGTTHQDGNVVAGTLYYYRVTSRDVSLNESGGSPEASGVPGAPTAPAGLVLTDAGTGQRLRLAWLANSEADLKDYGVYRATFTGAPVAPPTNIARIASPGTTHQDAGLTSGTTYYYRLTARDASLNESPGSAELSSVPNRDTTPPGAVTIQSMTGGPAGGQLTVLWTASGDDGAVGGAAAAYLVRVSTLPIVTAADFAAATPASFLTPVTPASPGTQQGGTIGGLTPGTPYYVAVVAVDDAIDGAGGNIGLPPPNAALNRVTTAGTPPPPPTPPLPPDVKAGASVVLTTSTLSLAGVQAVPGDTIEIRITNSRTGETQTISVKVDVSGTWSLTTPHLGDGTYNVQMRQVDPNGSGSDWSPNPAYLVTIDAVPEELRVAPAGPNPFRPGRGVVMSVGYDLNEMTSVAVSIHTPDGSLVKTLLEESPLAAGRYGSSPGNIPAPSWDGTNESGLSAASGIYLCRVKIGDRQFTRKILLIR